MDGPRPRGHVDRDGNLFATSVTPSHWTGRDLLLRRYSHFRERKPLHRLFRFNPPLCLLSTSHGWPRHQQKKRILLVARKSFTYIITNRQEAICTVSDCRWKTHRNQYPLSIVSCGIKVTGVFFVSPQTPIRSHLFAHHTFLSLYIWLFFLSCFQFIPPVHLILSLPPLYITFPQRKPIRFPQPQIFGRLTEGNMVRYD